MIASNNTRSRNANYQHVNTLLANHGIDILGLQEVWKSNVNFVGYDIFKAERNDQNGGGVAIVAKNSLTLDLVTSDINKHIEYIIVSNQNLHLVSVYRPPKGDFKHFLKQLTEIIRVEKKSCFIMGDFNIDLSVETDLTYDLKNLFTLKNMRLITSDISRHCSTTDTQIDGIFSNDVNIVAEGTLLTDFSDHFTPFCILNNKNESKNIPYRCITQKSLETFKLKVATLDFSSIYTNNIEEAFKNFHNTINTAFNTSFPLKVNNKPKQISSPWLTRGLKTSIRNKAKLLHKYIRKRSASNELRYKNYRNLLNKIIRLRKRFTLLTMALKL